MIREYLRFRANKKRVEKLLERDAKDLMKSFILDSRLVEAQQLSTLLGLPEVTPDDVAASERRAKRIHHLLPLVSFFAVSLTESVMTYFDTVASMDTSLDDREKAVISVFVAQVAVSCTLGVLSQFDELQLIKVTE